MANVSSFFGTLTLATDDNPWTPEGYLLAYDVLMSQDSSSGSYGFTMSEDITTDSAEFLAYCLSEGPEVSIPFWGNGRWSADYNFTCFNSWTKNKSEQQTMTDKAYKETRTKLLGLMLINQWKFVFEYIDEECGVGLLCKATNIIWPEETKEAGSSTLGFNLANTEYEDYEYNLKNYSLLVDETRESDYFNNILHDLCSVLNIPDEQDDAFAEFIISHDLDIFFNPYDTIETKEEIPEKFITVFESEWKPK